MRAASLTLIALLAPGLLPPAAGQSRLKVYPSTYYDVHSDLGEAVVREAILRSDLMVREYSQRTRGFAGRLTRRLPLYLFSNPKDYAAAGALPGSVGTFQAAPNGDGKLLVLVGARPTEQTWRTLQHEGFHQFVHAVIGGDVPVWVNEGLAEYFAEGVFTGDDYVTGVVHPGRLRELKRLLEERKVRPLAQIMTTGLDEWNSSLSAVNYTQAWSMVHFLAHGSERHEKAFNDFIRDVSRGRPWEQAWKAAFGTDVRAFEKRWRAYWQELSPDHSADLYRRAVVLTMTGFYGRAVSQQQRFGSFEEFLEAARAGRLKAHRADWLPPSLLERDLPLVERVGTWSLDPRAPHALRCQVSESEVLTGTYELSRDRIKPGSVKVSAARAGATAVRPRRRGSRKTRVVSLPAAAAMHIAGCSRPRRTATLSRRGPVVWACSP
jgi:hypothetical protein